jgi:hypothetical protein
MDAYATHIPVTALAIAKTGLLFPNLPILECGCGDYSSPMIELLKGERKHHILSSDPEWAMRYKNVADLITMVEAIEPHRWGEYAIECEYGLCLLDSEELVMYRMMQIPRLLKACRVIVMHDARSVMASLAKFTHLYTRYMPNTWIGSDSVDVAEWFAG